MPLGNWEGRIFYIDPLARKPANFLLTTISGRGVLEEAINMALAKVDTHIPSRNINHLQIGELDPGFLMRDAFTKNSTLTFHPSDLLLAWILRIPTHTQPAEAAKIILDFYSSDLLKPVNENLEMLISKLNELSLYNPQRLSQIAKKRRLRKSKHLAGKANILVN